MLFIDQDPDTGTYTYMVCNDAGLCLIRTTSSRIANFVERHSQGVPTALRLTVGGDPGTRTTQHIWQHVRRWSK
jgi:hypothetical protein